MRLILLGYVLILFFCNFGNAFERCGTQDVEPSEKFFIDMKIKLLSSSLKYMSTNSFRTKTIPIIVHIIEDKISDQIIYEQINVLNNAYALTGFRFELKDINFVNTNRWSKNFEIFSAAEIDMKSKLRQGDSGTLNIYIMPNLGQVLGWAYFPWEYRRQPELDGVVIAKGSLPRGQIYPYNEGVTLVHEVGHWMGLFHTFQGGCEGSGDFVDDTPAQQSPSVGCPINNDSCPFSPGLDPSDNYMDYSNDICLTNFSRGQIIRMTGSFESYRNSISTLIN